MDVLDVSLVQGCAYFPWLVKHRHRGHVNGVFVWRTGEIRRREIRGE